MSENFQFHANVTNNTGQPLTLAASPLENGKWMTSPPAQIADGAIGRFAASGTEGSMVGTTGNAVYQAGDNTTKFTISWSIPYSGSNSGGMTCAGNCANYTATSSPASFPVEAHIATQNYTIGPPA